MSISRSMPEVSAGLDVSVAVTPDASASFSAAVQTAPDPTGLITSLMYEDAMRMVEERDEAMAQMDTALSAARARRLFEQSAHKNSQMPDATYADNGGGDEGGSSDGGGVGL